MAAFKPVVGIDFGTTNTSASYVDQKGLVRMLPISDVDTAMPTVVWLGGKDKLLVGAGARGRMLDDPPNTIWGFKRLLGRAFKSEFVGRTAGRFPYKVVEGDDGMAAVEAHGEVRSIKDLAFNVMARMLELATAHLGDVDACVLTVPSHYGFRQRLILRTAAEMAGWDVRALVNEPTAAALYFAKQAYASKTSLIYDLGGGTFDATLIQVQGSLVKVLGTGGDAFLGGHDFDERIAQALATRFETEHGVRIQDQRVVMQRLMFAAETAKMILSTEDKAQVRVMFAGEKDGRPLDMDYTLNREMFDMLIAPLVERTMGPLEELVKKAGLTRDQVDELILVGRQTRTLAVRRRVYSLFKGDPVRNPTPELSVPCGAALLASKLDDVAGPPLVDVVSVPIWMVLPGQQPRMAVHANTAVPSVGRIPLDGVATSGPLTIWFYEALEPTSVERDMLGSVKVDAAALAQGPATLEVTMLQNFNLEVSVRLGNGRKEKLVMAAAKPRR